MADPTPIEGTVHPKFERVREAFEQNFRGRDEVGATVAVVLDGEPVVDLWGGYADRGRTRLWEDDTLVNVYSTTKGLAALCVAMLVDRGAFAYDTAVVELWPEFGAAGKGDVTVETLLSHQAGLCGLRDSISVEDYYDHDKMAGMLAAMEPWWTPGTANGYHAMTYGFLAGELVRRATGKTLGAFFASEIAEPLRADFFIGLPQSEDARVAEMIGPKTEADPFAQDPSPAAISALSNPPLDMEVPNTRAWRAAEIPAANGQGHARGLARIYGELARGWGDLISAAVLTRATQVRCEREDLVLGVPVRWSAGWIRNTPPLYGPGDTAYGHSGAGGSFGFADPERRLGVGYAMNQMFANLQGDPRGLRLVDAVYASL